MIKLYMPTIEAFMLEAARADEPVIYIHEYSEHTHKEGIRVIEYFIALNCKNDRRQIIEFIASLCIHQPSATAQTKKEAKSINKEYLKRIEAGLKKRQFDDVRPGYYSESSIFGELPVLKGIKK